MTDINSAADRADNKAIGQYLRTYAEPEVHCLPEISTTYDHCLVIPAFNEEWRNLLQVWQNLRERYLVILVVNSPEPDHAASLQLLKDVKSRSTIENTIEDNIENSHETPPDHAAQGRCSYLRGEPDILLVDRASQGNTIDSRHGVGLARKIGADIALRLIADRVILSKRISVTDADAVLPADYLQFKLKPGDAALCFPFRHLTGSGSDLPTRLYDISLLYYACGLDWAGSAYAYTSLGSTIAISSDHYAMVRGFPRRSAAEDFYLLNKLAKTGKIRRTGHCAIILSGRLSDRVPVGTGPGIRKIQSLAEPTSDYLFYNPGIFILLQQFLEALGSAWESPNAMQSTCGEIRQFCGAIDLGPFISDQLRRQSKKKVFDKMLSDWFDGFRTLKFIHFMRDQFLPSVPLSRIGEAAFLDSGTAEDLPFLRAQLYSRLFPDATQ